jgi:hypothetical protein
MRSEKKLTDYYTPAQTKKILGITDGQLYNYSNNGTLERIIPPGRKQGVYRRSEVNRLAKGLDAFLAQKKLGIEFREATVDDIDQEADLARLVFGDRAAAQEERRAFVQENPRVDYHLYDQGKLVAYIDLIPLEHHAIMDWVEGRAVVWDIDPKHIKPFEPGKPVECLIADMITSPIIPLVKRTYYGRRLLKGLLDKLIEMGNEGIEITKIYAGSSPKTPQGLRIIGEAGFQEVYRRGEKVISVLDVMNSDKKILRPYQEAINQWQTIHKASK